MRAAPRVVLLAFGLALSLGLGASGAQAEPAHDAPPRAKKAKRHIDVDAPVADTPITVHHRADNRRVLDDHTAGTARDRPAQTDAKQVAFQAVNDTTDRDDALHKDIATPGEPAPHRGWQVQLGPYIWASSASASVALGPISTGVDVGFISLLHHTRYGAEFLGEIRHGRFALSGDVMYGAADASGSTSIASVMMTLSGNVTSLLVDAAAGYQVIGDDDAPFSVEARSGIRYQRTTIRGELAVAGITVQSPELVDAGSDLVVGARAVVRPTRAISLTGVFDVGVAGASDSTWSASIDAGLRVSRRVLLSAGWRTLTTERSSVNVVLAGPRAAVQMVF